MAEGLPMQLLANRKFFHDKSACDNGAGRFLNIQLGPISGLGSSASASGILRRISARAAARGRRCRCPVCGAVIGCNDNAALSIKREGLHMLTESPETGFLMAGREPAEPNACGHYGRHDTLSGQLRSGGRSKKPPHLIRVQPVSGG